MKAKILLKIRNSSLIILVYQIIFALLTILPKRKKLIIFESFNGRQYSDNPRAIYEYMLENCPEYTMVWSVDRRHVKNFKGKDIPMVYRFSIKWLFLVTTAKYWITNSRMPQWFRKSNRTVYVQTWHGTPLKKLGIDIESVKMPGVTSEKYKKDFLDEARKWDFLVSPNTYSTKIFRRAFGFDKNMIESGYPRNDFLVNNNNEAVKEALKKKANLPLDKKVILYAPTWRDDEFYDKANYKFSLKLDLNEMRERLGEKYVVILRLHYLVSENLDLSEFENFAYDFSSYEDIRDLYLISDLLITDYSSVFFDYSILKRPIVFYVYDIENYRDNLRGFYFDFEENAPGPLLKTSKEVIYAIEKMEKGEFLFDEKLEKFRKTYTSLEKGTASKEIVNKVFKKV